MGLTGAEIALRLRKVTSQHGDGLERKDSQRNSRSEASVQSESQSEVMPLIKINETVDGITYRTAEATDADDIVRLSFKTFYQGNTYNNVVLEHAYLV